MAFMIYYLQHAFILIKVILYIANLVLVFLHSLLRVATNNIEVNSIKEYKSKKLLFKQ